MSALSNISAPPEASGTVTEGARRSWSALVAWARAEPGDFRMAIATAVMFLLLFAQPFGLLMDAWWNDPNSGHGLLLVPVAIWLAFSSGLVNGYKGRPIVGGLLILIAVLVRVGVGTAVGYTLTRLTLVPAVVGLVIYYAGFRQIRHWWLPLSLFVLSVPAPFFLLSGVTSSLQFVASQLGAALLRLRDIPVLLQGNVIRIPGHELFVTEACSGLHSLVSLVSVAVLIGGLMLRGVVMRVLIVAAAIVVAVLINGIRVFLTGFLVLFVDPAMGEGFMHYSEGLLLFGVSMAVLFLVAQLAAFFERKYLYRKLGTSSSEVSYV